MGKDSLTFARGENHLCRGGRTELGRRSFGSFSMKKKKKKKWRCGASIPVPSECESDAIPISPHPRWKCIIDESSEESEKMLKT